MDRPSAQSQPSSSAEQDAHRLRNGVISTVALALLLLGIGLAVPDLRGVVNRATSANWGWLAAGVGLELASCLGYVAVVRMVIDRCPPRDVRRLAWAEQAFGAVVAVGGAGGLAVGAWAMRAWGISWAKIANRSAVIFLLTSAINAVVLAAAGLGLLIGIGGGHLGLTLGLVPAAAAVGAVAFFALLPRFRRAVPAKHGRVAKGLDAASRWVQATEKTALRPNVRMVGAFAYLLCDIFVLWACMQAVGVSAPILPLIIAYQVGYLANLIPIPGSIGVLEGGLLGALLLYGMPAAPTAAAVILYHAIALWVPTLGGTYAFVRLRGTIAAQPAVAPSTATATAAQPAVARSTAIATATATDPAVAAERVEMPSLAPPRRALLPAPAVGSALPALMPAPDPVPTRAARSDPVPAKPATRGPAARPPGPDITDLAA